MGKEQLKSISPVKLYSPWQTADLDTKNNNNNQLFGLVESNIMDENMTNIVLQIEREQKARMERDKEEDDHHEEKSLLKLAKNLDIHSSNSTTIYEILKEDQLHSSFFNFSEEDQSGLVSLEQFVADKEQLTQGGKVLEHSLSAQDAQVRKVYSKIGEYFGKYNSGKVPKAFKIIPSLSNWDEILLLTKPSSWTPQVTYEATKVFLSNVKARQTKLFFELVLLPNFRHNITSHSPQKELDLPIMLALQKAITKCPALFIKGFLFPLCESRSCTLVEASFIAEVIASCHIPVLHSATALLKLSELPFTLPTSILVLVLLEKRQALPCRVVDALVVKYFAVCQQIGSIEQLPHIWFQSLYLFIQTYGMDLVPTQEKKLLELIRSVKPDTLSKLIEQSIIIKASDDDNTEEDSDDNNQHIEEENGDMMVD